MNDSPKLRILIFSLAYFPFVGGAEIAVKEITDRLGDRFDFDLITYKFNKSWLDFEKLGSVSVYRVNSVNKFLYIFKAWFLAKKFNKKNRYSAVWSIMAAYAGASAMLFKLSNPKIPFLLTLQEGDSEKHILKRVGIFYPIWKLIFKKADYIQAISNYLADFARRRGAKCPIEIVPNGVDLEKFKNQKSKIKIENQNSKIIITTSRLVHKNGIDILIRAAAELKTLIHDSEFIIQILGSGPEEQNLKKLAKNLGLVNEVIFLGHIEPDSIPQYLIRADVFIRPSRSEGLGSSFLEAMAAGLPVIGTPVGGIPDFLNNYDADSADDMRMMRIADKPNGIFTRADDLEDLVEKMGLLLNSKDLCELLGKNGKRLIFEKYSWDSISNKMLDILTKLSCGRN